jgi:hypothetical protein
MQDFRAFIPVLVVFAVLAWTAGCTDSLAPRESYGDPFAVYGLLTPDRDTQFVWVYPIEEFPTLGTPDALEDVTVTSTDLETGETRIWSDTVLVRENGQHEYLYRSPFRAAFNRRYRIDVLRRSDLESSWAEVRIPPPARVELIDANRDTVTLEILGEGIMALNSEIEYHVRTVNRPDTSYMRQYWGKEEKIPGGWRFKLRFNIDRFWVEAWYTADMKIRYGRCPFRASLFLGEMRLHAIVGDTAWAPPGPVFDPYILSQPGTMENVENGSGFIGGGYRIDALLNVPQDAVEDACFVYCRSPWNCERP